MRLKTGPWGGGNQFATSLVEHLSRRGFRVSHDLAPRDINIILLTEPRRRSESSAFNDVDILRYLTQVSARTLVVHRVNECDAARGTRSRNLRLALANRCADHTVFISAWLQETFRANGYRFAEESVIRNGANRVIFHSQSGVPWNGAEKLRLVTHHWSDNWEKGFDVYERLDRLLGEAPYRHLFEFTCVGRLPRDLALRNTRCYPPLFGEELAGVLRAQHVYVTSARNEGAGMHHIEGAMCGLPVLHLRSGAVPEYCEGFGVPFEAATFEQGLLEMRDRYAALKTRMPEYPYDAERTGRAYEALFENLLARRDEIVARRRWTAGRARLFAAQSMLLDRWDAWH